MPGCGPPRIGLANGAAVFGSAALRASTERNRDGHGRDETMARLLEGRTIAILTSDGVEQRVLDEARRALDEAGGRTTLDTVASGSDASAYDVLLLGDVEDQNAPGRDE